MPLVSVTCAEPSAAGLQVLTPNRPDRILCGVQLVMVSQTTNAPDADRDVILPDPHTNVQPEPYLKHFKVRPLPRLSHRRNFLPG